MGQLRLVWVDRRGGHHVQYADDTAVIGPKLERLAKQGRDAVIYGSDDRVLGQSTKDGPQRVWWWDQDAKAAVEGVTGKSPDRREGGGVNGA